MKEPAIETIEFKSFEQLRDTCLKCSGCGLRAGAKQVVFGKGNPCADIMFVGEAPGKQEDEQGEPFVGAAGNLLDKIFAAAGINRDDVFITNVAKCRPPGNRFPRPDEVETCRWYLNAQIKFIDPLIIVCLGALATKTLINPQARITRIRGQWFEKNGIKILPTYHPAALLRDPGKKRPVWEDFQELMRVYKEMITRQMTIDW
ncbi:MAG TPA: uracil-DNA glycosylase [Clostridia bacterium]|jgi:uracil-DNA glycosylase family 4|nr:uracil-DNA glycosylase [Clostridia bacterium]